MRASLASLAATILVAFAAPVPNGAAFAPSGCVAVWVWTFSPPLSPVFNSQAGTVTVAGQFLGTTCVTVSLADCDPVPPPVPGSCAGAATVLYQATGTYAGDCLRATANFDGWEIQIEQGSLTWGRHGGTVGDGVLAGTLTPADAQNQCLDGLAQALGVHAITRPDL